MITRPPNDEGLRQIERLEKQIDFTEIAIVVVFVVAIIGLVSIAAFSIP